MPNGIYPAHPYHTSHSTLMNRSQGMLMPMPANTPQPGMPPQQGGMFTGPQGAQQMSQIYGLLSQYADDPTQVGMDYVRSAQQQQVLDRQNAPIEKFLQLYGNVNPYDWTAQSLQKFHDNYVRTGGLEFGLLEPKTRMSGQLEKAALAADEETITASNDIIKFQSLADRYMQAFRTGAFTQGAPGAIKQWIVRNISGDYDDEAALIQDVQKFINKGAIKDLPAGPATDRDLDIARKGYPPPNASPEYWASYLRGLQKARIVDFAYNEHKSRWYHMKDTSEGQLRNWMKKRNNIIRDAWEYHGLSENLVEAKYSDEEAAQIIAQRQGMYMPTSETETYGTVSLDRGRELTGGGGPSPVTPTAGKQTAPNMSWEQMHKELYGN